MAHRGADTNVTDLAGQMVMPGVVDVHNHILLSGKAALYELQFAASATIDEICEAVAQQAAKLPAGQWIAGNSWGADMTTALNTDEALRKLDAASPDHPVMLRDESQHNRWVNSVALKTCSITETSEDPEQGTFARDPSSGRLTGVLLEAAAGVAELAIENATTDEMRAASVARAVDIANSFGITGFQEAATTLPVLRALADLDRAGGLSARAVTSLPLVPPGFLFGEAGEGLLAQRDAFRTAHVMPTYTKIFLDGIPGTRTAAFHDAYLDAPGVPHGHRGEPLMEMPELIRHVARSEEAGMGLKVHCTGDLAVTMVLDAVEAVRHLTGPTTVRHQIAHASYIRPEDIPRFAALGVVADLCPIMWFPTAFLEGHKEVMGVERAERFWPIADLVKAGALIAGGSDWPVIPLPNPWIGIEGMVTRQNPFGEFPGVSLWADQAIDVTTALRAYTINSATAMGIDHLAGSLEPGKSADFIVLDRNLFECAPSDIGKTQVATTVFEGRTVYAQAA
ncbi:MAG: amidohydrolase [Pseudomonadota bacterium]